MTRSTRRKFPTYSAWARHHRVPATVPFVRFRCAECSKENMGQVPCGPRNWYRVPDVYVPSGKPEGAVIRTTGLLCEACGDHWIRRNRWQQTVDLGDGLTVTRAVAAR